MVSVLYKKENSLSLDCEVEYDMDNNKDFDELLYLLDKYKDKITIKVHHYIQGNINSGIIGHRSDYSDYEDIEEVGKDKDGNIELSICVMD